MRIRTIKPEFFTHEGLFDAERAEKLPIRLAFAGLWCACDRSGRFKWEPRRLGVSILPYDEIDFSRVLDALLTRGFLVRYRVGDAWFGAIPSWDKHQCINNREKQSTFPDVSAADEVDVRIDASGTRQARVRHATQEEGKGREGERIHTTPPPASSGDGRLMLELDPGPVTPGVARMRARDKLLEALAAVDGSDPMQVTRSAWPMIATALKDIKAVTPDVTPEEIKRRRDNYVANHPTWACTAPAIAKHWAASATLQPQNQHANNGQRSSRSFDNQQDYSAVTEKL